MLHIWNTFVLNYYTDPKGYKLFFFFIYFLPPFIAAVGPDTRKRLSYTYIYYFITYQHSRYAGSRHELCVRCEYYNVPIFRSHTDFNVVLTPRSTAASAARAKEEEEEYWRRTLLCKQPRNTFSRARARHSRRAVSVVIHYITVTTTPVAVHCCRQWTPPYVPDSARFLCTRTRADSDEGGKTFLVPRALNVCVCPSVL